MTTVTPTRTDLVLMIVMTDYYLRDRMLDNLRETNAAMRNRDRVEAARLEEELQQLRGRGHYEVVGQKYKVARLGHGIAHPGRVVGFYANGVLTAEEGAPLPDDETLQRLISEEAREHAVPLVEDGQVHLQVSPNRAFQTALV